MRPKGRTRRGRDFVRRCGQLGLGIDLSHLSDQGAWDVLRLEAAPAEAAGLPMDGDSTGRCLCLLACAPGGVQAMSADIPGLVQTSLNLGILRTAEDGMTASFCVRSALDSQKGWSATGWPA